MALGKPYKSFIGLKVKTWTVVSEAGFDSGDCMTWLARCECGQEKTLHSRVLPRWLGHCQCTGGRPNDMHPLYGTWANMKHRCLNPKSSNYPSYGGRGITVCDRWLGRDGFKNFVADMGDRPEGTTLDRVNPNGNYEPDNVRWATPKQQVDNRRLSRPRVIELLRLLDEIISEHPATTAAVMLQAIRKQLLGSST